MGEWMGDYLGVFGRLFGYGQGMGWHEMGWRTARKGEQPRDGWEWDLGIILHSVPSETRGMICIALDIAWAFCYVVARHLSSSAIHLLAF